jgi:hypothetical protein
MRRWSYLLVGFLIAVTAATVAQEIVIGPGSYDRLRLVTDGQTRLQIGPDGVVTSTGNLKLPNGTAAAPSLTFASATDLGLFKSSNDLVISTGGSARHQFGNGVYYLLSDTGTIRWGASSDVILTRDAANILALKNAANAQEFRVYGTTTGPKYGSLIHNGTSLFLVSNVNSDSLIFGTQGTNRWQIFSGGSLGAYADNTYDIGAAAANRPRSLYLGGPAITAGSGTGVTVDDNGSVRDLTYKVTVASTAFVCAATTCDVTIATLPAKAKVLDAIASLTTTFACTGTCTTSTLSILVGNGAGGSEYLASLDADAATAVFGDADAERGSLLTRAAAIGGGAVPAWATTQNVVLRLTSGTGNIGNATVSNLSQGTVTVYLVTRIFQ